MGQYCFHAVVCRRLSSSSVMLPVYGLAGRWAHGRSARRRPTCTAGHYGNVPLGRYLVVIYIYSILINANGSKHIWKYTTLCQLKFPYMKELGQLPYLCRQQTGEVHLRDHLTSSFTVTLIITVLRLHLSTTNTNHKIIIHFYNC